MYVHNSGALKAILGSSLTVPLSPTVDPFCLVVIQPNSFCEEFVTFRDAPKCKDEIRCDFADPELLRKLQDIQPPPLDVTTVTTEETCVVFGSLPRGTCTSTSLGASLPPGGGPSPTPAPVTASTNAPVTSPTADSWEECDDECYGCFQYCAVESDERCEDGLFACEEDCFEEEQAGDLDERETEECIDDCGVAFTRQCWRKGNRKCRRTGMDCLATCEGLYSR
jgi:hypothetical protein